MDTFEEPMDQVNWFYRNTIKWFRNFAYITDCKNEK